jgi:diphthamide synthase (EF-2-diphthine--ammonia ligase)
MRRAGDYEVVGLVTTINSAFGRVAMHAVPESLLQMQADAVGLLLWPVPIPWPCSNQEYEAALQQVLDRAVSEGIGHMAFGDLFLADIREYREQRLEGSGVIPLFPIWRDDTGQLAQEMITAGLRATIACLDPTRLPAAMAGREFDQGLLLELPDGVDHCGENGEFHTFAWDGPAFRHPVRVSCAGAVERDGFVFADLSPA